MGIFQIFSRKPKVDIQSAITTFKQLGFVINNSIETNEPIDVAEHIQAIYSRLLKERSVFEMVYIALGDTEDLSDHPICDSLWHFDTECIEDQGDYVKIIQNIERISDGDLKFEDVEDSFDHEANTASVSFKLNGDSYSWDLLVENDWVDPTILSKIVELSKKYKTKGKLTYFNTGGQDMVLGWLTENKLKELRRKTRLDVVWFN